jgi:hypothetical protein
VIRTDIVLTLRDLRGEHASEERRIPSGLHWQDRNARYVAYLIEMAGVALDWRKDDRLPVPDGERAPRDEAVLNLVKDIAAVIRDERAPSLHGADCSLVCTWEPAADA